MLTILSVSLLHTALTSHPSYLAGKGEEHRIKKTQTYTTADVCSNLVSGNPIVAVFRQEKEYQLKFKKVSKLVTSLKNK